MSQLPRTGTDGAKRSEARARGTREAQAVPSAPAQSVLASGKEIIAMSSLKKFCKRGHEYTPGKRGCLICARMRDKRRPLAWRQCSRCKVQFKPERNQNGSRIACCPECVAKHPDECRALVVQAGRARCACGQSISKGAKQCLPCKRKSAQADVLIWCDVCRERFKASSPKQYGASFVACPTCWKTRRKECWQRKNASRPTRQKTAKAYVHGGTMDRVVRRVLEESRATCHVVYDAEKGGALPENLLRAYPALAIEGSITCTKKPPTLPPPSRKRVYTRKTQCAASHSINGLSIQQFIEKRAARAEVSA